jgi:hypothetical protein
MRSLEIYLYGDGHETKQVEVDGYLWGYKRKDADGYTLFVDRISPSLSSRKHQNWVRPNPRAAEVLNDFMHIWAPEVSLLGDFHSHPYANLAAVNSTKGYYFSDADFEYLETDDLLWEKTDNLPIIVVMTVCKLERVHEMTGYRISSNTSLARH